MQTCNTVFPNARKVALAALLTTAWTPMAHADEAGEGQAAAPPAYAAMPIAIQEVRVERGCEEISCMSVDLDDLAGFVPSLTLVPSSNEGLTGALINGVGTIGNNAGMDPAVGLFVDGVYRSRTAMDVALMDDVERVDITSGSQTARLGRNATAGSIEVFTRRADGNTRFTAVVGGGSDDSWRVGLSGETALGDKAAVRLTGQWRQRDGFTSVSTGAGPRSDLTDGDVSQLALRGQLAFDPSDNFSGTLDFDVSRSRGNCCVGVTLVRGPFASYVDVLASDEGIAPTANPEARRAWANRDTDQNISDVGGSLRLEWGGNGSNSVKIRSTTALRRWNADAGADIDQTSADFAYRQTDGVGDRTRISRVSQDLAVSAEGKTLDWSVGVNWSREKLDRNESTWIGTAYEPFLSLAVLNRINPLLASSPTAPLFYSQASGRPFGTVFVGQATDDRHSQTYKSLSVYTDNTWHVSDQFDLGMTLRYSWDNKSATSSFANPNGGLGCGSMLGNPAQVVAALVARGLSVAQASAAAPQVVGFGCIAPTNLSHAGRATAQNLESNDWSGNVMATYKLSDDSQIFASAGRGYGVGGFNLDRVQSNTGLSTGTNGIVPVNDTSYGAQTVEDFGLGFRSSLNNGKIRLGGRFFHQRYSNFQVQVQGTTSMFIRAVPRVTNSGFEADVNVRSGRFNLYGGVVYADAKYGDDPLIGTELLNLPGNRLSLAPQWRLNAAMGYNLPLSDRFSARLQLGMGYVSQYNTSTVLNPLAVQDGYILVDARVTLATMNESWELDLWGRNLTDETYVRQSAEAPFQTGTWNGWLGAPRTLGASLRYRY